MRYSFFLISALCAITQFSYAVVLPDSASNGDTSKSVSTAAYADYIDSTIQCYYEDLIQFDNLLLLSELATNDSTPIFERKIYERRLDSLDKLTPFDLTYNNTIEAFIHLYVSKKRSLSSESLGRSQLYFPMFEEALDKYDLPLEIKYLAVVESGLNPVVKSRAGATGLWQFMYGTGKNFGLTINSYVDDRCDPRQSTEAACKYLSYLHKMFGDWNLALAAYNCGEGRVSRAIRRSGGKKSYWDIYPYLPRETRGYVPAFIAVNYLFAHHTDHLIYPIATPYFPHEIDSVHVVSPVSFDLISELVGIDVETISMLNPVYKINMVPAYNKQHSVLYLPKDKIVEWIDAEEKITKQIVEKSQEIPTPQQEYYYKVKPGDYLGKIAARNGCTVTQLQDWNGLRSTRLSVGQKLVVYGAGPNKPKEKNQPVITSSGNLTYYSIRSGDTLWDIAKAQGVSLEKLKTWNADIDFKHIKPGQKIIVKKA